MRGYSCRLLAGLLCVILFFSETGVLRVNAGSVSQNEPVTETDITVSGNAVGEDVENPPIQNVSSTIVDSGKSGYCSWSLDSNGLLTITGSREMLDYSNSGYAPWYKYRDSIKYLSISEGITHIGRMAFEDCTELVGPLTLPSTVESIGASAFYRCSKLTGSLVIPEGVTEIGYSAFSNCSSLDGTLTLPSTLKTIDYGAFYECSGLNGELVLPDSLESIGNSAFGNCSGFSGDLIIPDSLTSLGNQTFTGCSGFDGTLSISKNITTIQRSTFSGCSGLKGDLTIPDNVTIIEQNAFEGCSALDGILTIPDGVTTIGAYTFRNCSLLKGDLVLPSSLTTLGEYAFYGCENLTGSIVIPDGITVIANYTFFNCKSLDGTLTIPDSVTTINSGAFCDCSGIRGSIDLPAGLTTLEDYAFMNMSSITGSVTIPAGIASISEFTFADCTGLSAVYIPSSVTWISWYAFVHFKTNSTSSAENLDIVVYCEPDSYAYTWAQNYNYETEDWINSDGTWGDTTWNLSGGTLTISGIGAMGEVSYDPNEVPWYAYRNSINRVIIEDGVTEIGKYAFYGCKKLAQVEIPDSVTVLKDGCFNGCENLVSVSIPKTVTEIGKYAFCECKKITEITIPEKVTVISGQMFQNASALETIIFEGLITQIDIDAFVNCKNLKDIYYPGTKEQWDAIEFATTILAELSGVCIHFNDGTEHLYTDYVITYDLAGGENHPANPAGYNKGTTVVLKKPTKTGYSFVGWYDVSNNKKVTKVSKKSMSLLAKWKPVSYTITFNLNGGSNTKANKKIKKYTIESEVITFEDPTRSGYIFEGWYTDRGFTNRIESIPTGSTGNVKLFAKWKGIEYYIQYHENGAPEGDMDVSVLTYGTKSKLKHVTFYYPGYTFLGWNTKENGKGKTYKNRAAVLNLTKEEGKTIDLYAMWGTLTYTVKFNANGGKGTTKAMKVKGGNSVELRKNGFKRTGYTFTGWNTRKDGKGASYSDMQSVNELSATHKATVTLYAQWKENTYNIQFDGNGAGEGEMEAIMNCAHTESVKLPACGYTKDGYVFKGWTTKKNGGKLYEEYKKVSKLSTSGTVTLYAKWGLENPNKLTVVYKGNGANGSITNLVIPVLGSKKIASSGYKMTGYKLTSWNTKADGSGTTYALGSKLSGGLFNVNKVIVLYAQWTPKEYKVTFKANNKKASGTMDTIVATYDSKVNLPECTFTYPGYRFVKWTVKANGTGTAYADGADIDSLKNNVTLYAQWAPEVKYPGVEVPGAGDLSDTELKAFGMGTYGSTVKIGSSTALVSAVGCRLCSLAFMYTMQPGRLEKLEKDHGYSESSTVLKKYADFYEKTTTASKLVLWLAGDGAGTYFSGADMYETDQNKVGSREKGDTVEEVLEMVYDGIAEGKLVMLNIGTSKFHYIVAYKTTDCDTLSADTIMVFDPAGGGGYCTLREAVDRCGRRTAEDPVATVRYLSEE